MRWHSLVGLAGLSKCVIGSFVNDPIETTPTVNSHKRTFQYRNETVEATLNVQSPSGLCDPSVKQHSGYFTFGKAKKQYFFWMFESRSDPVNDPTVMWLTGGPGCSSMTGLLFENGPCKVSADGKSTTPNPYSWTTKANVMWVDQPPGTGFSKGSWDSGEDGVAEDMYQFLQVFFKAKPEYNKKFFVTGESYAGHYIPAVTHRIFEGNSKLQEGDIKIELKGMGIGNGLTNPQEQYKWYQEYMCTGAGHAVPPINSSIECAALKAATVACEGTLKACNSGVPVVAQAGCAAAMETCALGFQAPYMATGKNPYDVRIKCEKPPLCYDMSNDVAYLNDPEVQKQLGVDMKFESCNLIVNKAFTLDFMKNYHMLIPPMLAAGIDVLIYAGDQDFICNWLGNEKWVQALMWDHTKEFNAAEKTPYKVSGKEVGDKDGKVVGELQSFANLHFLRVAGAGHMVPLDQPEAALGMLNDLLAGAFLKPKLGTNPTHYGDPANGCESDEEAVRVQGISGDFCSPKCSGMSCPSDVPSGVTANPQCALQTTTGAKYCALLCTPSVRGSGANGECGSGTCQAISGIGICTYAAPESGKAPTLVKLAPEEPAAVVVV